MPVTIILVLTELRVGGAEQVAFDLAAGLDRTRFRPVVAALDGRGSFARRFREAGIPVYDLGARSRCHLQSIIRLRRLLRREGVKIVHSHLFHASLAARLAVIGTGIPTISTIHIAEERPRPWHFRLDRWTGRWCRRRVCVSAAVADFHARKALLPRRNLEVIHNGIDLERFSQPADKSKVKEAFGLDPKRLTVGAFGRFDPQKGMDIYLDAVDILAQQHPEVQFVLAGYGPDAAEFRARSRHGILRDHLKLFGPQEAPEKFYQALEIMAFPSRYEGQPLVLIEAMAAGLPVAASAIAPVREVAGEDEEAVLLVPPQNASALAGAISRLIASEPLRKKLSAAARKRSENFSARAMVNNYEKLYSQVLANGGGRVK